MSRPGDPHLVASPEIVRAAGEVASALADPVGLERLLQRHRSEALADPHWIHPTWLARALQEESPAVRAVVAEYGPPVVRTALGPDAASPKVDRRPHPEVLGWVLSLWSERLVGGSDRDDQPPVVAAIVRTSPREAYRLWQAVGRVKASLATEGGGPAWLRERFGTPSADIRAWAARDVAATAHAGLTGRRGAAGLGLVTTFRLLADCEPFVARWAFQRLPYPVVRQGRALVPPASRRSPSVSKIEGRILKVAWERLLHQGRIATPHPGLATRTEHES